MPVTKEELASHAERNGGDRELVDALRSMNKDSFDGPNAVMKELKGSLTGSGTDHHRPKGASAGRGAEDARPSFGSSLPTPSCSVMTPPLQNPRTSPAEWYPMST